MPKPRKALVCLDATPYYHCSSRCVRHAFLCGKDAVTGASYEHRRQWIEDRLLQLATIFSIDLAAYAVMSNHYHVVLHVDRDQAQRWSAAEVIDRWHQLFKGTVISQRFSRGETLTPGERAIINTLVALWRERLSNISWFMRVINEGIARQSNKEDGCTGRFWEGRFDCQALLDEKALATCAVYVDLNPIRARLAATPETSDHTSVKRRVAQARTTAQPNHQQQQAAGLLPFAGNPRLEMPKGLPFLLTDYLALVDWTGRVIREDKHGAIDSDLPPILKRLAIDRQQWVKATMGFERRFKSLVGTSAHVRSACLQLGKRWSHSLRPCRESFPA